MQSLYTQIHALPTYTMNTKNLTEQAMAVRDTIARSKSPEHLLFIELPYALGHDQFSPDITDNAEPDRINAFFTSINNVFTELNECYSSLLERIWTGLLTIFDVSRDNPNWRKNISILASRLYEHTFDLRLRTLLLRARDTELDRTAYIESIGGGIVDNVPSRWRKVDEDNFTRLVPELASKLRSIESTTGLKSVLEEDEKGYLFTLNDEEGNAIQRIVRFSKSEQGKIQKVIDLIEKRINKKDKRIATAALIELTRKFAEYNTTPYEMESENEE